MGELSLVLEQHLLHKAPLPFETAPPLVRPPKMPVFAGGAVLSLLITDPAARPREFTKDVDVIVEILTRRDQMGLDMMLHGAGFTQPLDPNWPPVAWMWKGCRIDFMHCSRNPGIGFGNLMEVMESAEAHQLETGDWIWRVSAPGFVAMKFAAWADRGGGKFLGAEAGHDAQDIVAVLDGRPDFEQDLDRASMALRRELATKAAAWLGDRDFLESLPLLLPESNREQAIVAKLRLMAEWRG